MGGGARGNQSNETRWPRDHTVDSEFVPVDEEVNAEVGSALDLYKQRSVVVLIDIQAERGSASEVSIRFHHQVQADQGRREGCRRSTYVNTSTPGAWAPSRGDLDCHLRVGGLGKCQPGRELAPVLAQKQGRDRQCATYLAARRRNRLRSLVPSLDRRTGTSQLDIRLNRCLAREAELTNSAPWLPVILQSTLGLVLPKL